MSSEYFSFTRDGASRHGLLVDPERHLGQDDHHNEGDIRLDQIISELPLEDEMDYLDGILA